MAPSDEDSIVARSGRVVTHSYDVPPTSRLLGLRCPRANPDVVGSPVGGDKLRNVVAGDDYRRVPDFDVALAAGVAADRDGVAVRDRARPINRVQSIPIN